MSEVSVTRDEIRISGSKAVLARVASQDADIAAPAVLSFVREWRAAPGEDDNYIYAIAL